MSTIPWAEEGHAPYVLHSFASLEQSSVLMLKWYLNEVPGLAR